jgi:hypothetical protein
MRVNRGEQWEVTAPSESAPYQLNHQFRPEIQGVPSAGFEHAYMAPEAVFRREAS